MSEQNQLQQLQNDSLILKARVFDLNELIQVKDQTIQQHQQLLAQVCSLLEIDSAQGVAPDAIIGAIKALLPVESTDDEAVDASKA